LLVLVNTAERSASRAAMASLRRDQTAQSDNPTAATPRACSPGAATVVPAGSGQRPAWWKRCSHRTC